MIRNRATLLEDSTCLRDDVHYIKIRERELAGR
jgi:hypothetical protein